MAEVKEFWQNAICVVEDIPRYINPTRLLPAASSTTTINGTPFVIVPSAKSVPLSLVPPGVTGPTAIINGTPYLVIPGVTVAPIITAHPGAQVTVISGTTVLVITGTGEVTIPVNPSLSLSGRTTVIGGTTEIVVSGATTVPFRTSGAMSPASTVSSTSTKKKNAAAATGVPGLLGVVVGGMPGVVVVL